MNEGEINEGEGENRAKSKGKSYFYGVGAAVCDLRQVRPQKCGKHRSQNITQDKQIPNLKVGGGADRDIHR